MYCKWSSPTSSYLEKTRGHFSRKQPQVNKYHMLSSKTCIIHFQDIISVTASVINTCRYRFVEDGSLHITSAQVTDTGRYLCMATNQAGSQRKRVDLQVYGRPLSRYKNT